jgi:Sulfotransferase family
MNVIKDLYRKAVPAPLRQSFWSIRHGVPRRLHDLRWMLASKTYLARWTDQRLQLGEHYWLFILGCNNSGTTLLNKILDCHPQIRALPSEGNDFTRALPNASRMGLSRVFTQRLDLFRWTEADDPAPAARAKYDWAYYYERRPGVLLEKTPWNSLRARWLQHNFRPSRFLIIVRNPYAVCEGIMRRKGHNAEAAATHWRTLHEILLQDMPHLDHCQLFRYEDLCADVPGQLERFEEFLELDLPFDRNLSQRQFRTNNIDNKPSPIEDFNKNSLERLGAEDIGIITSIAGSIMRQFGYEPLQLSATGQKRVASQDRRGSVPSA